MSASSIDHIAVERLQARYIRALDTQDLTGWKGLFSRQDTSSYICTTLEHVKNDLPLALMMDDCRARIEDRVTYVTKVWAGTFQNYQTRHFTQLLEVRHEGDGSVRCISAFSVHHVPEEDGTAAILTTGEYHDIIAHEDGEPRFVSKRAILDTSVLPRYIVYPI